MMRDAKVGDLARAMARIFDGHTVSHVRQALAIQVAITCWSAGDRGSDTVEEKLAQFVGEVNEILARPPPDKAATVN